MLRVDEWVMHAVRTFIPEYSSTDVEFAWALGQRARAKAETEFSIERCAREHREIYKRLWTERAPA